MSSTIGVRELKNQASRVLRVVREEMTEYVITLQGKPVEILRPFTMEDEERLQQVKIVDELKEIKEIARDIAAA